MQDCWPLSIRPPNVVQEVGEASVGEVNYRVLSTHGEVAGEPKVFSAIAQLSPLAQKGLGVCPDSSKYTPKRDKPTGGGKISPSVLVSHDTGSQVT